MAEGHHRLRRERVQGKGSMWRSANGRRPLQTRTIHQGDTPPAPRTQPRPPNPCMESEGASGCPWSTARATARLLNSRPPE